MYRIPSRRRSDKTIKKPNLIPILDAVFIFIFFLLVTASFIKIFEIPSDVPLVSSSEPPKKPLALTVKIFENSLNVYTGVPSTLIKKFGKTGEGEYDTQALHEFLIGLKQRHKKEKSVILEPLIDIEYIELVKIMDAMRTMEKTDPAIFVKDKDGVEIKLESLFDSIIFGNIQS